MEVLLGKDSDQMQRELGLTLEMIQQAVSQWFKTNGTYFPYVLKARNVESRFNLFKIIGDDSKSKDIGFHMYYSCLPRINEKVFSII